MNGKVDLTHLSQCFLLKLPANFKKTEGFLIILDGSKGERWLNMTKKKSSSATM